MDSLEHHLLTIVVIIYDCNLVIIQAKDEPILCLQLLNDGKMIIVCKAEIEYRQDFTTYLVD